MEKKSSHKASTWSLKSNAAVHVGVTKKPTSAPSSPHHHSGKHRSSTSSHHHSHPPQQQRQYPSAQAIRNNNNSLISAKLPTPNAKAIAAAGHTFDQMTAANQKTMSVRNKNEEAIADLRQRIPEIENIFDVHSRIGNGTFSTVLLGTLKKEREMPENMRRKFAIKHHIPTSHPDRIMKELQCMAKIGGSDNVVGINCCIRYNESVAFIMPYMPHDRFHDFFNKMDLREVQYYIKNLLIALRHVHKFNVIHRDVKPSNFLYNRRKRQFLLVDFGLAQQVPTPQMSSVGSISTAGNSALPPAAAIDGKRAREHDEVTPGSGKPTSTATDVATTPGDSTVIGGVAKRLRCSGPQGDQLATSNTATPNARVTVSCNVMSGAGSTFKMPLKQLNEISTPVKVASNVGAVAGVGSSAAGIGSGHSAHSGVCEVPLNRQVKSAMHTGAAAASNRLQQKIQAQSGGGAGQSGSARSSVGGCVVPQAVTPASGSSIAPATPTADSSKYNTNRNLSAANGPKCFCYGNPQVCNICLIKKEIHASRAGTPGYRPPEVLLKYPDQTTAVDVWASGVILLSILSSVYPFFKAPNDYVALAEMVTIFGDKTIRKTAFVLDRLVTLSQKTKPLDLRKLCVRFRNRSKFSSPELLRKYQRPDGSCEVCKNCDQFFFNCLCTDTHYTTEPLESDDPFPPSAYDLLYRLLEVNPHKRITADEALKHPFFSENPTICSLSNNTSTD